MKKQTSEKEYCGNCGTTVWTELVGAEKYAEYPWGDIYHPYSKYDAETGKRQLVRRIYCRHSKWWNNHTDYLKEKIILSK